MSFEINSRSDFSLPNYARVAWCGESVKIGAHALDTMTASRKAFMKMLDEQPELHIYGVTSGYGQNAKVRLEGAARAEHAARAPFQSMAGFGPELPERIKRGIVFCRLTNFISGHAGVTPELASHIAAMLDEKMPRVPARGNTSAGEIIPLSHLFVPATQDFELAEKETIALINGSPCATALMADIALSTERRITLALDVFCLSIEALRAPLGAYDQALEDLYGDNCIAWVLQQIRQRIDLTQTDRRTYQAPVSWRILPQVLGQLVRAQQQLLDVANTALQAVTDNPVVVMSEQHQGSVESVLSNGGFHNANACAAIDGVAGSMADVATLADRHISKLFDGNVSGLPPQLKAEGEDGYLGCIGFTAADYAERAQNVASRSRLTGSEGGGFGQNDVLIPIFQAWEKCVEVGEAFDSCLAILAVTCSQAFHLSEKSRCPAELQSMIDDVRFYVPPVVTPRATGFSIGDLQQTYTQRIFEDCVSDTT